MIHAKLSPGNTGRVPASRTDLPIALGKSIVGNSHRTSGDYRLSPSRKGTSAPATASPDAAKLRPQAPLAGFRASAEEHLAQLHLLIVDDDPPVRSACAEIAGGMGFATRMAESVMAAREALAAGPVDLVLLDLRLPGGGGLTLLDEIRSSHPETLVLVMTAYATVSSAVEAMRIGASDYLTKPFSLEDLSVVLERAAERRSIDVESRALRERLRTSSGLGDLIGRSPAMEKLYRILSKVAHTTHPLLILGESGTGKELVARSIHNHGPNADKPFIAVDCGSLVPSLIESELFGYVKGSFTGANRSRTGLLAAAEGGTVFLDEVAELPLDLQTRLLRALQEKEIRPIGSNQAVPINARILAATNRDLTVMVETGQFRKDLFFRLNVVNLRIPPLRERKADIPLLAAHVLERVRRESGLAYSFSDDALRLMMDYDWPGNVREMEHAIERVCALSSGPVLHMADFPTQMQDYRMHQQHAQREEVHGPADPAISTTQEKSVLSIAELEKNAILSTIRQLKGDKLMAARLLGIGKTTLYRKLKEYGLGEDQSLI
jgi:two-component system response regulator HydG